MPACWTPCKPSSGSFWWQNEAVSNTRRPKPLRDVAAICGKDERGLHILRRRSDDGPIEAGILQPLIEGKPIAGEVISMKQRQDVPFLFDVETQVPAAPETPEASGLAQVATESYRRGWDAIWGRSNLRN